MAFRRPLTIRGQTEAQQDSADLLIVGAAIIPDFPVFPPNSGLNGQNIGVFALPGADAGITNPGGTGGEVDVAANAGGAGSPTLPAGNGGLVFIKAGDAGADNGAGGAGGGGVNIKSGNSTGPFNSGGSVSMSTGQGGDGDALNPPGGGGSLSIFAGNAGANNGGGGTPGGQIGISTGAGSLSGSGGDMFLSTGPGQNDDGVNQAGFGGNVLVQTGGGGSAPTLGVDAGGGGKIQLRANDGGIANTGIAGAGGDIEVFAGSGGSNDPASAPGLGGNVLIFAGDAGFVGAGGGPNAGNVEITGGTGSAGQFDGEVQIGFSQTSIIGLQSNIPTGSGLVQKQLVTFASAGDALFTQNHNNAGALYRGVISGGGADVLCDAEDLNAVAAVAAGDVLEWAGGGANGVQTAGAVLNSTNIAGVAITASAGGTVKVARRFRVLTNADPGIVQGDLCGTSLVTPGAVQSGIPPAALGALVGRACEATGATVAGKVILDLILG